MIQLTHPWALLALASIPTILALYSLRPRRRTVAVSTNALWRQALAERSRGIGLQKLLRDLGLLVLLVVALLAALALADPHWLMPAVQRGDAVIVLDVSASMQADDGGTSRFERARRAASDLIDTLPAGARVLLMTSGRAARLRTAFETDRDLTRRALAQIEPGDMAGRPRRALELGFSLLESRERGRVHFFTDGAFDEDVDLGAAGVEIRQVGSPARNVAITRFDLRQEIGAADRFQALVTVRNYTGATVVAPLRATLGRRQLLERELTLEPDATRTLVVPFRGRLSGRARAWIEVDDALAADDQAFAAVGVAEALHVLIVGPGNVYLESAFEAFEHIVLERLDEISPAQLERLARRNDVVVLDRVSAPELPPGSYLLVDTVPPGLALRETGSLGRQRVQGRGASALLGDVDLTGLRIDAARRIATDAEAPGLQRLFWSAETDLALALLDSTRRIVYLGFDLHRSNLPLQAAFPVVLGRSVEWLRPRHGRVHGAQLEAGAPFEIRLPPGVTEVVVRDPDGEGAILSADDGVARYDSTERAGVYRYDVGSIARHFAVNLTDAAESDLEPRAVLPAPLAGASAGNADAQRSVALWPYLLGLIIALLALEWGLWCARPAHG